MERSILTTPNISDTQPEESTWLDKPLMQIIAINWETVLFVTLLIAAVLTRFYDLGLRVMSHDETSHVYFSWLYERGNGYSHDPVTHGPLQFHLLALSYFLFGDSDLTARIPAALFSVATVAFMWGYRRILGRSGALIAAALYLISPYILYYGRYARNEAFVGLFGVMTLWAILRYLEQGSPRYLLWLTAATALHFTAKETSFIYTAQALIFLAGYLVYRLWQGNWQIPAHRNRFLLAMFIALLLFSIGGSMLIHEPPPAVVEPAENAIPDLGTEAPAAGVEVQPTPLDLVFIAAGVVALIVALYFALQGFGWARLRAERAFAMLVVLGSMVLPMLAPFPVKWLGFDPIDYQNWQVITLDAVFMIVFAIIAIALGVLWNWRQWLINVALFYAIFIVFYTSLFTNGFGFITGLAGSLGYWLAQQGVERGSQPWYYYALLQVPIYEYLPAIGSLLAILFGPGLVKRLSPAVETQEPILEPDGSVVIQGAESEAQHLPTTTYALLVFWSITSLIAYTIAGEKMPWLTVHITLPMILLTAWLLGRLIDLTDWDAFRRQRGALVVLLLPVFFISMLAAFGSLLGPNPPFQGKELSQLRASSTFITAALTAVATGWGIARLVQPWSGAQLIRVVTLAAFGFLGVLTARTAFRAAYINYDNATEYLVYAHMARGPKEALEQIEEISQRTTNGLGIHIAYDDVVTYPYWWYLRDYPNKEFFDKTPTRSLREATAILVGDNKFDKIEPIIGQAFHAFEYTRIWWPNQDYFNLTWQRIFDAFSDPQMRAALFQIWLNRDYTLYGQLTNQQEAYSLPSWGTAQKMRLYVRKDIIASLWNYGVAPSAEAIVADPYEGKGIALVADRMLGEPGNGPAQFQRPRDLAVAPDGTLYIADTENHRIQHLDADGNLLHSWGSFAASSETVAAPEGTFNEPWGIAIGPDGAVFVADTWNHRIQKFSPDGRFLTAWGYGISQTDDPFGFYGPRDVAVNSRGQVFVTDTGNKRVVIFDENGNFQSQFGGPGFAQGEFDEPVGLAVDGEDNLYVADTWNQRIQVFSPVTGDRYAPKGEWDVVAWYGQSLDNKPFIAVDPAGLFYAADPEGYRVLQFTTAGEFLLYWGDFSTGADGFSLVGGVAVDPQGGVWVSDTNNNRLMHFNVPQAGTGGDNP